MKTCKMEFINKDGVKTFEAKNAYDFLAEDLKYHYIYKAKYIARIVRKQHYTHETITVYYGKGYGGKRIYTITEY